MANMPNQVHARGIEAMSTCFLDPVDWQRPWLTPFHALATPLLQAPEWRVALNGLAEQARLFNHRGLPIRFVPQSSLPPQTAYEAFISTTGCVPTRENLHDFFNALVWLHFPRIKVRLNALQAAEIEKAGTDAQCGSRGPVRDATTLFDENAALLVVQDAKAIAAWRAHRWREIFIERRDGFWRNHDIWLFGHALMEKLVAPYKAITAHAWPLVANADYFDMPSVDRRRWLDETVACQLACSLKPAQFTPVPVLGIPSWWPSQSEKFYEDPAVFRPVRVRC
jgi:hypothetical protein